MTNLRAALLRTTPCLRGNVDIECVLPNEKWMWLSVGVVLETLIAIFDHQRFVPQLYVMVRVFVCVHKPSHKDSGLEAVAERIKCEDFIPEMENLWTGRVSEERGGGVAFCLSLTVMSGAVMVPSIAINLISCVCTYDYWVSSGLSSRLELTAEGVNRVCVCAPSSNSSS